MLDWIGDAGSWISDKIGDTLSDALSTILYATIYKLLYYIGWALCKIILLLDGLYEVFAGMQPVSYDGSKSFLIEVFFRNHAISQVYWGMAVIGLIFAIVFALIAVIRRIFDLRDKDQRSMGQIIGSLAKTVLLIISMNLIIVMVLNATNLLMQQIGFLFDNVTIDDTPPSIDFTEEQYAAMGRCLNTLGNYYVNPSYDSRLNINACYNELRSDLDFLVEQGVFKYHYVTKESAKSDAKTIATWQSVLEPIANARDTSKEMRLDVYDESVYNAIKNAMKELSQNTNLRPLSHYDKPIIKPQSVHVPLDRYVFLVSTFEAAKSDAYNRNPDFTDPIRGPYYSGTKSIYDFDSVKKDFDIGIHRMNYLVMYIAAIAVIWDLVVIVFSAVTRIFNMILLYLISPLVFAAEPLDDGAKRKQWTTAFLVQTMGIFATIIAMRLSMLFIPLIVGSKLVLFENSSFLNLVGKIVLILGLFDVVKKANGLVTGILADSAGWQSIQAGDSTMRAEQAIAKTTAGMILPFSIGWGATKLAGSGIKKLFSSSGSSGGGGGSEASSGGSSGGGGGGGGSDLPENKNK